MIKALKLGVKSLGYAHGLKRTCAAYLLLMVTGVLMIILGERRGMGFIGGYFMLGASMAPVQLLYSLSMSDMVQASPAKKRLQTSAPAVVSSCCMMISYLGIALIRAVLVLLGWVPGEKISNELVTLAMLGTAFMMYLAVAYKYFVVSAGLFVCICYFIARFMRDGGINRLGIFGPGGMPVSFLPALLSGMALIAAGGILEYLISLAVYKAPMSKIAQRAA